MIGSRGIASLAALSCALSMLVTERAHADSELVETDNFELRLGGYFRSQTGWTTATYELINPIDGSSLNESVGSHVDVARLEWTANFGENVTLDVHQRFLWSMRSSTSSAGGTGYGVNATTTPQRTVNLSSRIIDEPGVTFSHDIDRLALRLYLGGADVVVGRQAISWGHALMFPVIDIWNVFSPFELDDTEKRGIDALRVITSIGESELEFVVADRGVAEDTSAGIRSTVYLPNGDYYAAAGKTWDELFIATGLSHYLDVWSLRFEGFVAYDYDRGAVQRPRISIGADYLTVDGALSMELHYNGLGARSGGYVEDLVGVEAYERGEVYLLGQFYVGVSGSYQITELLTAQMGAILNATDPSAILSPTLSYSLSQDLDVGLGSFVGIGESPSIATNGLSVPSEFGAANAFTYLQLVAYY